MGTKRPSWTLFDTLPNQKNADQPDGRISGETSHRPSGTTGPSNPGRGRLREEERRGARELERMKENPRRKDGEPLDRRERRDLDPVPRTRGGERELREQERKQVEERLRNGRPVSHFDPGIEHDMDKLARKGGTFPRMGNGSKERAKIMTALREEEMDRHGKALTERPTRTLFDWEMEQERERARRTERHGDRERYRERERDGVRTRVNDEGRPSGGRTREERKVPQRERQRDPDPGVPERRRERDVDISDLRDRREREIARERERSKLSVAERERKVPSPRRRDREVYYERERGRETWEKAKTKDGKRDTKSEGESDGVAGKSRVKGRGREEYRHSRSEGDNIEHRTMRKKDRDDPRYKDDERYMERQRYREVDGLRQRDQGIGSERERALYRERDGRKERDFEEEKKWKDGVGDRKERRPDGRQRPSDRREWERYRDGEEEARRYRARAEEERRYRERREKPTEPRQYDATGSAGQPVSKTAQMALPQGQSSGEWSSDVDSESRRALTRDCCEEIESEGESTAESNRDVRRDTSDAEAVQRGGESERSADRQEERTGQRRMWLEPQRRKCSKDSSLEDEFVEFHTRPTDKTMGQERRSGRDGDKESGRQHKEHYGRLSEGGRQVDRPRHPERQTEGVGLEEEEEKASAEGEREGMESLSGGPRRSLRDVRQGNVKDGIERSDREAGSDCTRLESEGGSETGWGLGREKSLSGEDDFITVSSGGDEEDNREEDEFEDCREFWDGGHSYRGPQPVFFKGEEEMGRQNRQGEDKEYIFKEEDDEDEQEAENTQQGKDKPPEYLFCVIGQTLPRTKRNELSETDQLEKVEASVPGSHLSCNDETAAQPLNDTHPVLSSTAKLQDGDDQQMPDTTRNQPTEDLSPSNESSYTAETISQMAVNREMGPRTASDLEHPYAEIGAVSRDIRTEKLLAQWREKQKEYKETTESCQEGPDRSITRTCGDAVVSQGNSVPIPTHPQTTPPEAVEPGEEEGQEVDDKRRSQAPHLKWAKSVVREILGSFEDNIAEGASGPPAHQTEGTQPEAGDEVAELQGDTKPDTAATSGVTHESQSSDHESGPEVDEWKTERLELEELRGRAQSRGNMHAEPCVNMHGDTLAYTHTDTHVVVHVPSIHLDREAGNPGAQQADNGAVGGPGEECMVLVGKGAGGCEVEMMVDKEAMRAMEVEMYLSVSNTLYKPRSCPCLNYDSDAHQLQGGTMASQHSPGQEDVGGTGEGEEERKGQVTEESISGTGGDVVLERGGSGSEEDQVREGGDVVEPAGGREGGGALSSSCSFRDLGPAVRMRRRGIRKTTERRKEERVEEEEEEEEEEGVGRDRRTRIFSTTDDEDFSKSWGEVDLRNVLDTVGRKRRNSKFFNAAQLYQQYSEEAQNIEILRQSHFDVLSVHEEHPPHLALPSDPRTSAPAPPAAPATRPLPPLPPVPHPHSLAAAASALRNSSSAKHLPLPETPKTGSRPPSPRLSISLGQSTTLWQDLPGVRNSTELVQLSEDQRRLQEVRFEVVTSEASYCRSLDIVVEHFVKSKQLGALLTTQDRNWLFSRFADVRAISHSFLSKLEEKVESDMLQFTVCDVIARHCQRFKMVYVPYLTNQSYQDATYQRLMNDNPNFKRVVEKLERSPVCQRLPLRSFLILPFQRITRIKLLVQNIVKRTAPGTEEVVQAIKALKLLEKMIQDSNDSISQMKSIESLVSLSARVDFECRTLPLISQSRRLVREGPVTELMEFSVKDTERNIYLHLFNDHLLLSLHKEGGRFTVIDHSPVSDLRAENCRVKLHSLQKNLFRLHLTHKALLLRTDTQSDKLRWISAISRPHPEVDFSAAQDFTQMQCIRAFVAQQPDELSLEKADVILVHQQSGDGWVEGTKLSDRHRGWMPAAHLETITNSRVCQRNLLDALKLTTATAAV